MTTRRTFDFDEELSGSFAEVRDDPDETIEHDEPVGADWAETLTDLSETAQD